MKNTTAFVISHEPNPSRTKKDLATSIIALTLTRALGRKGVKVIRVHPNFLDDSLASRYCENIEICPDLYADEAGLTAFLNELADKYDGKKVLVPASDDCSLYLARNERKLDSNFVLLNPSADTMQRVKDKKRQYALAKQVGVPIPETYFPQSWEELVGIAEFLEDYPYVIKPLEAEKWRLSSYSGVAGGQKAITVHNREQLIAEYERISIADPHLMVQEIIAGEDEHLVTFLGYCSEELKPLAHCIRSKLRQFPVDFGYCTSTVTIHNDVVERQAKLLLNQAGYTGIVGIEFKRDPKSGEYKLIEINTRPVNTTGIAAACGVDLPVIAYRDAIGESQQPVTNWEDGVIWMRLIQDIGAARELSRQGRLNAAQWFRSIRGKRVHALLAMDDMAPFLQFYWRYTVRHWDKLDFGSRLPSITQWSRRWLHRVSTWMF